MQAGHQTASRESGQVGQALGDQRSAVRSHSTRRSGSAKRERRSAVLESRGFQRLCLSVVQGDGVDLDEKVLPLFAGQIRIIFKHFPLDGACNKQVNKSGHARACEAAGLAESARVQRGNEGFWKAHDALFARQAPNELLAKLDVAEVIAALGLDPKQTHAEMKSPAITERINEDVTLARNSGVTATPWLILNDKVVDGIAANDLNFWHEWPTGIGPRRE